MLAELIDTTLQAGKAILAIYDTAFEVETKDDNSPLTAADKAANAIICERLAALSPYPVLSEESAEVPYAERQSWSTFWLVDPLDGTKEFIKRNGEFTVNIALVEQERVIFGLVYAPVLDALYVGAVAPAAEANVAGWLAGAPRQAVRISAASKAALAEVANLADLFATDTAQVLPPEREAGPLRIVASKSHCNDDTLAYIAEQEETFGPAERVARGSSLKLCMVAESAADLYPRLAPTMEWDTAAAQAVVEGAGGRVIGQLADDLWTEMPYNKVDLLQRGFIVESGWYRRQTVELA